jgi:hypothetical protein
LSRAVDIEAGLEVVLCAGIDEVTLDECDALAEEALVSNGEDVFLCVRHFEAWQRAS